MKTLSVLSAFVFLTITALSQKFEQRFAVTLPDSVDTAQVDWVDIDNDGLLDAVVMATSPMGNHALISYKSDTTLGFIFQQALNLQCINASYVLADVNIDNAIDVIVSGEYDDGGKIVLFENQGDFTFVADTLFDEHVSAMATGDLNLDARDEIIVSGTNADGPFLKILKRTEGGWTIAHDSLAIHANSIQVFDFDNDGKNDFFVSGRDEFDKPVTAVFNNANHFYFRQYAIDPAVAGQSTIVDLTTDGRFDILVAGKNESGLNATLMLVNQGSSFEAILDSIPPADTTTFFAADFDLNGKADIQYFSINHGTDSVNVVLNDEGDLFILNKTQLHAQRFGDFDRDGDLDVVQLTGIPGSLRLLISIDTTALVNNPPDRPAWAVGAEIFDRYFFYWERSMDDHTPVNSITYDFSLQTANDEWSLGDFDLINKKRLRVSHGNTGTNNFLFLDSIRHGPMNYWIQAIDNTFHAGPEGVCASNSSCPVDIAYEQQPVCENEPLVLHAPSAALWFSFKQGFLGESSSLTLQPATPDTVFSFTPGVGACGALKTYVIRPQHNQIRQENAIQYVCEGRASAFAAAPGWAHTEWRSKNRGFISDDESILFSTMTPDTLSITMTDNNGCGIRRDIVLNISRPVVTADPEIVQILRGEEVQINVTNGFSVYTWAPTTGLDNPNIFNPIAAPATTTTYTATVQDSVGCAASAKVHVIVEGAAFIPNLFTPNNDGRNDVLKIYGLENATDFAFTIHTREGAIVYETKNVSAVTSMGWDGTARGNSQASGIYYWKVEGKLPSGRTLLLNGKKSGSIVLLR